MQSGAFGLVHAIAQQRLPIVQDGNWSRELVRRAPAFSRYRTCVVVCVFALQPRGISTGWLRALPRGFERLWISRDRAQGVKLLCFFFSLSHARGFVFWVHCMADCPPLHHDTSWCWRCYSWGIVCSHVCALANERPASRLHITHVSAQVVLAFLPPPPQFASRHSIALLRIAS